MSLQPLARALEMERRFSSDVSHELKTPLAALKTSLEVSLHEKSLSKDIKELLNDNLQDVDHLDLIVRQLLTLAKAEQVESKGSTSIEKVMKKVQKIYKTPAKKKNISLVFPKELSKTIVGGTQSQLVELLSILVDNAIKFTPKNGVVEVQTKNKRGRLEVIISDTGPGIDPKSLPYIFERFVKGNQSRTRTEKSGLGLGLSIAKQIVDQVGGEIFVRTTPKKGSSFTVSLPT